MEEYKNVMKNFPDVKTITRSDSYAQIPNDILRDKNISFKARGILSLLLSHEEGWVTYIDTLYRNFSTNDGRTSVASGLKELEEYGYLERKIYRDGKTKRMVGSFIAITDTPYKFDYTDLEKYVEEKGLIISIHPSRVANKKKEVEKEITEKDNRVIKANNFISKYLYLNISDKIDERKHHEKIREMRNDKAEVDWDTVVRYIKKMDYNDYVKTMYWSIVSTEVKKIADYKCQLCNHKGFDLNAHHNNYKILGHELDNMKDLICLCAKCHKKHHGIES